MAELNLAYKHTSLCMPDFFPSSLQLKALVCSAWLGLTNVINPDESSERPLYDVYRLSFDLHCLFGSDANIENIFRFQMHPQAIKVENYQSLQWKAKEKTYGTCWQFCQNTGKRSQLGAEREQYIDTRVWKRGGPDPGIKARLI